MTTDKLKNKKYLLFLIINAALVIACAACLIAISVISHKFPSQEEWKRWKGDNSMNFDQISIFIPMEDSLDVNRINTFRNDLMGKFKEASIETDHRVFLDCWSCEGSDKVYSDDANCLAAIHAVGGSFFDFHPLTLVSGSYIDEQDLMEDRVVLDKDLAWFLFGGTDVAGLTVTIGEKPFLIAGVVEREQDFATEKAYTAGNGLFMSYDAFVQMKNDEVGRTVDSMLEGSDDGTDIEVYGGEITCYEVCLPNPVKNWAMNSVQEKFPLRGGVVVENCRRFSFANLFRIIRDLPARTMNDGVPFPYWENALRYAQTKASILMFFAFVFAIVPVVTAIVLAVKHIHFRRTLINDEFLPSLKEKLEETIRVRQRKIWEKKHPDMK